MITFFSLIKMVAISQLIIVCLLIIFAYMVKLYFYYKSIHHKKVSVKLEELLRDQIITVGEFNINSVIGYKHLIGLLIDIINKFDATISVEKWLDIRHQIIDLIILPAARVFAVSRAWNQRLIACQSFSLSYKAQDEFLVMTLINDSVPLVSINAAILAVQSNSQALIDTIIDCFAKGRHVQQSFSAHILSSADATVIPLIKNRLRRETNPYVRAFCYRILMDLPCISEKVETTSEDLRSSNLELKLSVMSYLSHIDPQSSSVSFLKLLDDPVWEVRAKAAKLLGDIRDDSFVFALELTLKDPQWWVRMNAAEALYKLGAQGLSVLRRQDPNVDSFAFEIATQILAIHDGEIVQ